MNDREMLGSVGSGFIMGNAMPQARAEAPAFTGDWTRKSGCLYYLTHWLDYPHLPYSPNNEILSSTGQLPGFFFALNLSFCAVMLKPHRINCRDFTFKIELKRKILCGRAMLDKIDRKLLALLQQDCTLSLQALAGSR